MQHNALWDERKIDEGRERECETVSVVRRDPAMAFLNGRHNQALITSFVCPSGPLTFHLPREKVLHRANAARREPTSQMEIVQRTSHRSIYTAAPLPRSSSLSLCLCLAGKRLLDMDARCQSLHSTRLAGHNLRETC